MSTKSLLTLSFIAICAILGISIYLQYFDGVMPCPLCTLQRLAFVGIGVMFLLGAIFHHRRFVTIPTSLFSIVLSILGFIFAARQTWLQLFPPANNAECGLSLQYMMNILPLHEVLGKVLAGSAECTIKSWEFLTLSMPEWAVIYFAIFFCIGSFVLIREIKH